MSPTVPYEIKGWCPGVQRPMQSGDGLLVRVRPWVGAFTLEQAAGLADIAATLGNGHIDLTRRANLQIRGLGEDRSPALRDALDRLGLLEAEEARNVMVDPLAGPEVRALALALGRALPHDLPAKFGCLVDGGGPLSIAGEHADIALLRAPDAVFIGGGLGDAGLFEAVWAALKPGGRLVANAVSLDSEARLIELFQRHGGKLARLDIAKSGKAGTSGKVFVWRLAAPIIQWWVTKP